MALEVLDTILEAERQADALVRDAQQSARDMIDQAQRSSEERRRQAEREAQEQVRALLARRREQVTNELALASRSQQASREVLMDRARALLPQAAQLIVERLLDDGRR